MTFYSYYSVNYETGSEVFLRKFNLVKETPKGYWIRQRSSFFNHEQRWISKTAKKRLAYPTELEAITSFIKRREAWIRILDKRRNRAKRDLRQAIVILEELETNEQT